MSSSVPAVLFASASTLVVAFQIALALGAPWGNAAMAGKFPGTLPRPMRIAALLQALILLGLACATLVRAGMLLPTWYAASKIAIWVVVAFSAIATLLNLITPNKLERMIWAPVAMTMLVSSLLVAIR
ncbi:MAG: hypothetical protein JWP01_504 [Myxococcales bacterium]|nr:hypothetical protein [Myxococcales bacterium]